MSFHLIVCLAMLMHSGIYDLILYTSYMGVLTMAGSIVAMIYMRLVKRSKFDQRKFFSVPFFAGKLCEKTIIQSNNPYSKLHA